MNMFKEFFENSTAWDLILMVAMIVTIIVGLVKFVIPVVRKMSSFLDDVAGTSARPGRPAVPGLFERIGNIETQQNQVRTTVGAIESKVNTVHHELFPNSGKSLRDQTNRIEEKIDRDDRRIERLESTTQKIEVVLEDHLVISNAIIEKFQEES